MGIAKAGWQNESQGVRRAALRCVDRGAESCRRTEADETRKETNIPDSRSRACRAASDPCAYSKSWPPGHTPVGAEIVVSMTGGLR